MHSAHAYDGLRLGNNCILLCGRLLKEIEASRRSRINTEQLAALVVMSDMHTDNARVEVGITESQTQGLSCLDDVDGTLRLASRTCVINMSRRHQLQC